MLEVNYLVLEAALCEKSLPQDFELESFPVWSLGHLFGGCWLHGSWDFAFSTMSRFAQANFPHTTGFDITVSAVSLYAFVLVIGLAVSSLLGAFAGLVFVKLAIRFPVRSVYLKAFGFAFCLWLISTIPGLFIQLLFSLWYPITLAIFECDSLLYAYIFNRWSRLTESNSPGTNSPMSYAPHTTQAQPTDPSSRLLGSQRRT